MAVAGEIPVREAARRIHRSPETIRRWIWSGRLPATKRGNTYYVDVMQLEGVAVEMGISGIIAHPAGAEQPGRLAAWLEELEQWKSGLAVQARETASDLVIEDRHARR